MQTAITNGGMRPINAIVDITNYVMMAVGQPLHAFDRTHVTGEKIIVRNANKGEKLLLLDENSIDLTTDDLVICDTKEPMALAGIKGGRKDSILPDTTGVVLEVADFTAGTIRNTGKRFDEKTDASIRYEKNIDTERVDLGLSLALQLFKEIYPKVTAGSEFNPMALADALPLYKSVSEKLVDEYGYSGIYIVFDEFSKFIEGQNNIAAGTNMHLLQSMCELATDSKNAQVFITMVAHKSIKEYGKYLSRDLINLFTGIEGRIIEKYFVTSSKNNYELIKNAIVKDDSKLLNIPHYEKYLGKEKFKEFYSLPAFRSGFDETEFKNVIFNGC